MERMQPQRCASPGLSATLPLNLALNAPVLRVSQSVSGARAAAARLLLLRGWHAS